MAALATLPADTSIVTDVTTAVRVKGLQVSALDAVDLFVYVVILNLAAQFVPSVISESFAMSLVTALLLKVVLEFVLIVKKRVMSRFSAATTPGGKVGAGVLLWVVLAGSKFVVLELEALLLGDAVSLGGFFSVTLLIITLMVGRALVRRFLARSTVGDHETLDSPG